MIKFFLFTFIILGLFTTMSCSHIKSYELRSWSAEVRILVAKAWECPWDVKKGLILREDIGLKQLKTTYLLSINKKGKLLDKKLLVPSGNDVYDKSVLMALNSIEYLPQPPSHLFSEKDSTDITMSFVPPRGHPIFTSWDSSMELDHFPRKDK